MLARQIVIASLLSFALLALLGTVVPAASGALDYCKADAARLCPGVEGPHAHWVSQGP